MQTTKEKVDTSKALDASLVDIESSVTESNEQDTCIRSGNDTHADDADIRPIYDEEPMAKVQMTVKINVFAIGQQHFEKSKFNNEGEVDQNVEQCHDTWKLMLQSHRNQPVVRQPTAFKSERPRNSKPLFASQVNVNNNLSKPVTTHYLPKEREAASTKPHHMIASSNSRISSKNMPRFSSNDMVHNHYLEEAKKKTQERSRNFEPSLMPSARSQSIANVGLRWVPAGKIFTSSTTKVESVPPNGSNEDITNDNEYEQNLDVSVGTRNLSEGTSFNPKEEGLRVWLLKRMISHKPGLHGIFN
nr:hypothetical protein [Tanacetum cinerariifolium]